MAAEPLLESVGALTIPRGGPVGIALALARTFSLHACELPSSTYHGPLVRPGLKFSILHHALARVGVGVMNLVPIFHGDHENPMPRERVSRGFIEFRADTFLLLYAAHPAFGGGASRLADRVAMIRPVAHINAVCI